MPDELSDVEAKWLKLAERLRQDWGVRHPVSEETEQASILTIDTNSSPVCTRWGTSTPAPSPPPAPLPLKP